MARRDLYSLFLLLVAVSGLAVHPSLVAITRTTGHVLAQPLGPDVPRTYWLTGGPYYSNWNGSTPGPLLTASDGDNVTIRLRSADGIIHNWFLDLNSNNQVDSNEVSTTSPDFRSTTIWLNFSFIAALGTVFPHGGDFTYRCSYHAGLMYGTFKFNAGPVASFNHSPGTPLVGHAVGFDASASWPSTGATITTYNWNFGDGNTTSSGNNSTIVHNYATNNTYTVILTIIDTASQTGMTSGTVTVLNPPPIPFDYQIAISPANASIFMGQSTASTLTLNLVSGVPENVTMSSLASPSDPTVQVSLNTTSGFPSFRARLSIAAAPSSLCSPDPCFLSKTIKITIIAISRTGVDHNATFTLTLRPSPIQPQAPDYLPLAIYGVIAVVSIFVGFVALKRFRKK